MSVLTHSLKTSAASAIVNSIYTKILRMYYFFGQTTTEDASAPAEADSIDYENEARNNIFAIKEVLPSDVCYVIPRIDYQSGTSYLGYSTRTNQLSYVYNPSNFSIYICIKAGISASTVTPSHTSTAPVTLADGYSWLYVYTVPLAMRDKFLTAEWIPVNNALDESFFSNGGVDAASIIDSGAGYIQNSTSVSVTDSVGNGHGCTIEPVVSAGKIVSLIIHNPGYGYVSPKIEVISPVATRKAILTASLSKGDIRSSQSLIQTLSKPGTIESVEILTAGTGYTASAVAILSGDGTGAQVSFTRNSTTGQITSVSVTNRGEGYTWASLTISDTPVTGGSGFSCHVNLSPVKGFGYDVVSDLRANSLMVYQAMSRETLAGNDFNASIRQYGLVVSPKTTDKSSYTNQQVSRNNFVTTVQLSEVSAYSIGTTVTNEFPVTANTKSFVVEEQIIGSVGALRLRAVNNGQIQIGSRYYKDANTSFVASPINQASIVDQRFVSACYTLTTEAPAYFDINTFAEGTILYRGNNRFVIISVSGLTMAVSSIDGGTLQTGDTLTDASSNIVTPLTVSQPVYDKKTGNILTIEKTNPITYSKSQSVSFRTVLTF